MLNIIKLVDFIDQEIGCAKSTLESFDDELSKQKYLGMISSLKAVRGYIVSVTDIHMSAGQYDLIHDTKLPDPHA